jgi:hypothetical protein
MIEVDTTVTPAVTEKTVPDVLRHAAMYIEEHGWVQGSYCGMNSEKCAISAIIWAAKGGSVLLFDKSHPNWGLYIGASRAAEKQLQAEGHHGSMVGYNDNVATKMGQVTSLLRRTADRLER